MPLPWPRFWEHVREEDRAPLSDTLTELLAHGALIGDAGRDRESYLLAREYQREISDYLAPLNLELVGDPDRPIFQLRPAPGDCGLVARFNKAETLLVLALWRIYHDARMEQAVATVVVTINDIWRRLGIYFEKLELPKEAQLREMLAMLRRRRLVRVQWDEDPNRFGESQVEILPTLPRVIPFENAAAWEQQIVLYQQVGEGSAENSEPMP
ncbi:MAG: DUF4194 domain-containing protein [Verrucomicrobia bacterium]|nr:DUF4194 domain-containing protein [Verrucomicrobiota bacterium]